MYVHMWLWYNRGQVHHLMSCNCIPVLWWISLISLVRSLLSLCHICLVYLVKSESDQCISADRQPSGLLLMLNKVSAPLQLKEGNMKSDLEASLPAAQEDFAIRCRDVCRSYGKLKVLSSLNLTVPQGQMWVERKTDCFPWLIRCLSAVCQSYTQLQRKISLYLFLCVIFFLNCVFYTQSGFKIKTKFNTVALSEK